jgi:hypothetical protein
MLALLGYLLATAFGGAPDPDHNPAPRALYVLAWVGVVPVSLVCGPVWRGVNPLRALHRAVCAVLRLPVTGSRPLPPWLGYWPAALGLAAFVWLELVPEQRDDPRVVGGFLLGYAVLVITASAVFGEHWFERGDPFEVYSTLVGALAPLVWRPGRWLPGLANPLRRLAEVPAGPGLAAVLAVWWGSTVFDGLSGTPWWATVSQRSGAELGVPPEALATGTLTVLVALVAAGYRATTGRAAAALVSTLIPIAVGYTIAHYASLLIVEGPRGLAQLLDPAAVPPTAELPAPVLVAAIQVTAVLAGHVAGVVAAHDRVLVLAEASAPAGSSGQGSTTRSSALPAGVAAGAPAPARRAGTAVGHPPAGPGQRSLADQIPLVLLMIAYTMIGIYLLVIA